MRPETQEVLRRVVDKASKLEQSDFVNQIIERPTRLSMGPTTVDLVKPTDESRDAFILTLRFFLVGNEATSFRALGRLHDPELSEHWGTRLAEIRRSLDDYLNQSLGEYRSGDATYSLRRGEILDTFLYGGLVHANNPEALARYKEWSTHPALHAMVELWFLDAMKVVLLCIRQLSGLCQHELQQRG